MPLIVEMDDQSIKREKRRLQQKLWRAANPEKSRAKVRAWALANPEKKRERDRRAQAKVNAKRRAEREARLLATADERAAAEIARKEALRQYRRAHYLANRERLLEQSRKWREANPGKSAGLQKAWRGRNREKVRASKRSRKTAKRITLVRELTKLQRGRCAYCRVKLGNEFHVDHITPLKRGGPDQRSNLQLACIDCNLSKSARDPIEFAQSGGRLL